MTDSSFPFIMGNLPPSSYLGESLYADYDLSLGLVRVWASNGSEQTLPLHFSSESLGALLAYAAQCYEALKKDGTASNKAHVQ
jgi:hypothetical protein